MKTSLDIQSAFDNVFENIQYLIDNQILEASKKDLKITVSDKTLKLKP